MYNIKLMYFLPFPPHLIVQRKMKKTYNSFFFVVFFTIIAGFRTVFIVVLHNAVPYTTRTMSEFKITHSGAHLETNMGRKISIFQPPPPILPSFILPLPHAKQSVKPDFSFHFVKVASNRNLVRVFIFAGEKKYHDFF